MLMTYPATLRDGKIEWGADGPPPLSAVAVPVHVTLLIAPRPENAGAARLVALQAIAATGGASVFGDPVEWQREQRIDRPLPGRDE